MTFALKDFYVLKKHFNDTIDIMLERGKKRSIDELPSPRKEEIQFLKSVLNELETRIEWERKKNINLKPYAEIFYGAMLLIRHDIKNNLGWGEKIENSLLYNRLNDAIGITLNSSKPQKPSAIQIASMYKAINTFLTVLYKDNDSRKGFNPENALKAVPLDKLKDLSAMSFNLEEEAHKEVLKSLPTDATSEADSSKFVFNRPIPSTSISDFTDYATLRSEFEAMVKKELADKNASKAEAIRGSQRAIQIPFVIAIVKALDSSKSGGIFETKKTAILAGALILVREQIGLEYGAKAFDITDISSSVVHTELSKILKSNTMSREDAEILMASTLSFILHMTVDQSDKLSMRKKHIFSDIAGFKLLPTMELLQKLMKFCRNEALETCIHAYKDTEHPCSSKDTPPAPAGILSYLGFHARKPVSNLEKKENEVEEVEDEDVEEEEAVAESKDKTPKEVLKPVTFLSKVIGKEREDLSASIKKDHTEDRRPARF